MANSLVVAASSFKPPQNLLLKYEVEVRCRPSIEVFGEFTHSTINQEEEEVDQEATLWKDIVVGSKILQLKWNIIPRKLVPLERLFNKDDIVSKPMALKIDNQIEDYNIGSEEGPQMIRLSKGIPLQYRLRYLNLFKIYKDVFSWSYEDLKAFDTNIIQHKIPLKSGINPCKQKLRQINLLLLPSIEKEIRNLLQTKIIVPLRYFEWEANLVPFQKKRGEIRLCVDFRNLKKASLKEN